MWVLKKKYKRAKKQKLEIKSKYKKELKKVLEALKPLKQKYTKAKKREIKAQAAYKAAKKELELLKEEKNPKAPVEAKTVESAAVSAPQKEEAATPAPPQKAPPKVAAKRTTTKKAPTRRRTAAKKVAASTPPRRRGRPRKQPTLNDMKVIEGVGPKIATLLKENGFDTWAKVAKADVDKLKELLIGARMRYQVTSSESWPQQAKMAAEGKWEELKKWQDEHRGGRLKK